MAIEYAAISINPNGDMNMMVSAGMFSMTGYTSFKIENAIPVENAENAPQAIPNPGIIIGMASDVLWVNIPMASMPSITLSNSSKKMALSSSETTISEPTANDAEKTAIKAKNRMMRFSTFDQNTPE